MLYTNLTHIVKEEKIAVNIKNIVVPYPDIWVWPAQLSYIAIYDDAHAADISPSPEFYESNDPNEPMMERVRRLARILRNNHTSHYY
jgi:hypothetical protein